MAGILGSKITSLNQDGGADGCFCLIKAKKIYAVVRKCGFTHFGDPPNLSKVPAFYLRRIRNGSGEESYSGPSIGTCCADGSHPNWSASTQYRIVEEYDPRICKLELKECNGTTQKNGTLGGHTGRLPCCICYGKGAFSGNYNAYATLSIHKTEWGTKECRWSGSYTYDNNCSGVPQTGEVSRPLTHITEKVLYENEFSYQKMEDLIQEMFEKCKFDDLEWNQMRQVMFKETEDGDVEVDCGEPKSLYEHWYGYPKDEYRCDPCNNYGINTFLESRNLRVEFYTNRRKKEERTLIHKSKGQFIPKTGHYWKIFVPTIFTDPNAGEVEKRDDFPIVCELVEAKAGEKIEIDPPEEPGFYIIVNCVEKNKKYLPCMERKNFPKILENL